MLEHRTRHPVAAAVMAGALLAFAAPSGWTAEAYPAKPIRIVVPFAAGVSEIAARLVGQRLNERWNVPVLSV